MAARSRRPGLVAAYLAVAAIVLAWGGLSPLAPGFIAAGQTAAPNFEGCGGVSTREAASRVAMAGAEDYYPPTGPDIVPPGFSREDGFTHRSLDRGARYKKYQGFQYQPKRFGATGMRIKMQQTGYSSYPCFRIQVNKQKKLKTKTRKFIERIGTMFPALQLEHPSFFKLKADRAVFWLRAGAQPTDMVANLLDRAGIIRRTGPHPLRGQWEWRIPKESGPDPPEGWSYDGPHQVSWNSEPWYGRGYKRFREDLPKIRAKKKLNLPLIEKYGFIEYTRIPVDDELLHASVAGSSVSNNFDNTHLPNTHVPVWPS